MDIPYNKLSNKEIHMTLATLTSKGQITSNRRSKGKPSSLVGLIQVISTPASRVLIYNRND